MVHFYAHDLLAFAIYCTSLAVHTILNCIMVPKALTKMCVASNIVLMRKNQIAVEAVDQQKSRIFQYYRQFYR